METNVGRRGSVKQSKNGTWYFVVDTTPAGAIKRIQTRRRGFPTRRAAQSALTRTLRDLADQTYVAPTRLTFGDYLVETWLPAVTATVRPSTLDSYARNIRIHVASKAIATVPLQQVAPPVLNALYADLLTGATRAALSAADGRLCAHDPAPRVSRRGPMEPDRPQPGRSGRSAARPPERAGAITHLDR